MESEYFNIDPDFEAAVNAKKELALELIDQISRFGYPKKFGAELVDYLEYRRKLTERKKDR